MNNDPKNKKPQDNKPQNGDDGRQGRRIIFLVVAALIATLLINSLYTTIANAYLSEITYNEFQTYLDKDEIAELEFQSDRMVILTRDEAKKPSAQQRLYYTGYIPNVSNDDLKDRLDAQGVVNYVSNSPHGRVFVFDDWKSGQFFWKEFLAGMFIVVVMTGLDQDMMQKNLSCKNLRDAQKDMTCYGIAFLPMNILFLALGVLLYGYCAQSGITVPEHSDDLLPMLAAGGYLGMLVPVLFMIGIVAAAFSSADSALTALTTSFCIDILGVERKGYSPERAVRTRRYVHIGVTLAFILFIVAFKAINSTSVIDAIYTMASYTYGPLLGLFVFGMFTRRVPNDKYVPYVAIAAPVICYVLNVVLVRSFGYHFGYELLLLNGVLTFAGLWALSVRNGRLEKSVGL